MHTLAAATVAALALAACDTMTAQDRMVVGGLTGAAAGLLTAEMLRANTSWTILTVLAGAAAGTIVARNFQTGECAYARGDGTYRVARC